jgi:hypothetical protein
MFIGQLQGVKLEWSLWIVTPEDPDGAIGVGNHFCLDYGLISHVAAAICAGDR